MSRLSILGHWHALTLYGWWALSRVVSYIVEGIIRALVSLFDCTMCGYLMSLFLHFRDFLITRPSSVPFVSICQAVAASLSCECGHFCHLWTSHHGYWWSLDWVLRDALLFLSLQLCILIIVSFLYGQILHETHSFGCWAAAALTVWRILILLSTFCLRYPMYILCSASYILVWI